MERIKQMSLKKAFFCLTMMFLLIAIILSALSILGISVILKQYGTSVAMKIGSNSSIITPETMNGSIPPLMYHLLGVLQFALPVIFTIAGLLSADFVFYRMKLKRSLEELQTGAQRIMQNDLDFSMQPSSGDELGQLCKAFEEMRIGLMKNNKELWRQMEERKRLNAAFSHDLRNPVTVLKGCAKILKKGLQNDDLSSQNMVDSLMLIEDYTERIEKYIEAMSSVQRLEQLQCSFEEISWETIARGMSETIHLIAMDSSVQIEKEITKLQRNIWIDKAIVLNVAENLVVNALRYAKSQIHIKLSIDSDMLVFSVLDDGPGFPQAILQRGAEPFLRGEERDGQSNHFGMGLYVSRLLCEKHNGSLRLQNTGAGALVTASFKT